MPQTDEHQRRFFDGIVIVMGYGAGMSDHRGHGTLSSQNAFNHRFQLGLRKTTGLNEKLDRLANDVVHVPRVEVQQAATHRDRLKQELHR